MFFFLFVASLARATDLADIKPRLQETDHWCWAAVNQMVYEWLEIPAFGDDTYQCGILNGADPRCRDDCHGICEIAGPASLDGFVSLLRGYPMFLATETNTPRVGIEVEALRRPLKPEEIVNELDAGRPIIAGIRHDDHGINGHVILIVAATVSRGPRGETLNLTIHDPAVYETNPYTGRGGAKFEDGVYLVEYGPFKDWFRWTETVWHIQTYDPSQPFIKLAR